MDHLPVAEQGEEEEKGRECLRSADHTCNLSNARRVIKVTKIVSLLHVLRTTTGFTNGGDSIL